MATNVPNYYAVSNPTYAPAQRNILSITNSDPVVITTTYDGINPAAHGYANGYIVRIYVPLGFGMIQLNQMSGIVTVINSTQFSLPIDTTNFDAFVVATLQPGNNATPSFVIPYGEINDILTGAVMNILPPISGAK